jgi:hypothetical protein
VTAVHDYLSTGCLHGQHDYCSAMTGRTGDKAPASCKFCAAPCRCPCHLAAYVGLDTTPAPLPIDQLAYGIGVDDFRTGIEYNLDAMHRLYTEHPAMADTVMGWMHWLDDRISAVTTLLDEEADRRG